MHDALTKILNYHEYDAGLATGGQPGPEQFSLIRNAGFDVIINLAQADSPGALENEADIVRDNGMQYRHIPVNFKHPEINKLEEFYRVMNEHSDQHRFIHCAYNWRVSAFMYLYRTGEMGVDTSTALADLHSIWTPDPVWSGFIRRVESDSSGPA